MPNNSALGYTMAALENASYQGITTLLTETAVSALPASLTTSIPSAVTSGMRLWIRVWGNTATGTISIAGKKPLATATAVTSTTTTIAIPGLNDSPYGDFVTPEVYGSVDSSGVTVSGLTNGRVVIYGLTATTRLLPGEFKMDDKRTDKVIGQQRGTFAESHMPAIPLSSDPTWEFSADMQPDSLEWLMFAGINSTIATTTELPSGGTSILGSTSVVTGSSASASSQPAGQGQTLRCTIGGAPGTAATVVITGTTIDGTTVSDTIVPSSKTAGVYYSHYVFASIASSGIVYGAFGGTATLTVDGFYGWQLTGTMGQETYQSLSFYQFDSVANKAMPFGATQTWEFASAMDKEDKFTAKGIGQLVGLIGDTSLDTQQGDALVQSQDLASAGWETVVYFDAISGTVGTTQYIDCVSHKISADMKITSLHTSQFIPPNQFYSRLKKARHELTAEIVVDMTKATYNSEYAGAFKKGTRRLVQIWRRSRGPIATISGTPYYLGVKLNMVMRIIEDPMLKFEIGSPDVQLTLKGKIYYENALGYDLQAVWVSRFPTFA